MAGGFPRLAPLPPFRPARLRVWAPPPTPVVPPTVVTLAATSITQTTATFHLMVDPEGTSTEVWWLFGLVEPPATLTAKQAAGSETSLIEKSLVVEGLEAGKTYFFRAKAENIKGQSVLGEIFSFTTIAEGASTVAVSRQFPPDKIALHVGPRGGGVRWGSDEPKAENVLTDIEIADEMPGGYKSFACSLGRNPQLSWADLYAYEDAYAYQPGVAKVFEGSLDKGPGVTGSQRGMTPSFLGYQAILEDNQAAQFGGINADLSAWGEGSAQRRANLAAGGYTSGIADVSIGFKDTGGVAPSILFSPNTYEPTKFASERWFYGQGLRLRNLMFDFITPSGGGLGEAINNKAILTSDDILSNALVAAYHTAPASAQIIPGDGSSKYAMVQMFYEGAYHGASGGDMWGFANIRVMGDHGISLSGTWPNSGLLVKAMLEYIIPNLAAPLTIDSNYVDDDQYIVPHAWYGDPTSVAEILKGILKYGLYDWFVYHGKRFELRKPASYGKFWKAYVAPSQLNEIGLDSQRLWRKITVQYQDVDGSTKTVGAIGSGATIESSLLEITDPEHPAVKADRTRNDILDLRGIGVPATAVAVGQRFLEEANLINRSGSATLSGYVMDDHGIFWPVACVKSGDWISFVDAADRSYRKIVNKTYRHNDRASEIDLDAPASGLEALLERLQAGLISLGLT